MAKIGSAIATPLSIADGLPLEIVELLFRQVRQIPAKSASPYEEERLGVIRFARVSQTWRSVVCEVGMEYYATWMNLPKLVKLSFESPDRRLVESTTSLRLGQAPKFNSSIIASLAEMLRFTPRIRRLSVAAPHFPEKIRLENSRSDWGSVFGRLARAKELEAVKIEHGVFDLDDLLKLLRSCERLRELQLFESEITIDAFERHEDIQLLSTPSFVIQHSLTLLNFSIRFSIDDLLVAKLLMVGSITHLRLVKTGNILPTDQFIAAIYHAAPRLHSFYFNYPLDQNHLLDGILPLLRQCRYLHFNDTNIHFSKLVSSQLSLSSLLALSIISRTSFSPTQLQTLDVFLQLRKKTILGIWLDRGRETAAAAQFLAGCRKRGMVVEHIEPPMW